MESLGNGWVSIRTLSGDMSGFTREFEGKPQLHDVLPDPDGTMDVRPRGWGNLSSEVQVVLQARLDALPAKLHEKAEQAKAKDVADARARIAALNAVEPTDASISEAQNGNTTGALNRSLEAGNQTQFGDVLVTTPNSEGPISPLAIGRVVLPELVDA